MEKVECLENEIITNSVLKSCCIIENEVPSKRRNFRETVRSLKSLVDSLHKKIEAQELAQETSNQIKLVQNPFIVNKDVEIESNNTDDPEKEFCLEKHEDKTVVVIDNETESKSRKSEDELQLSQTYETNKICDSSIESIKLSEPNKENVKRKDTEERQMSSTALSLEIDSWHSVLDHDDFLDDDSTVISDFSENDYGNQILHNLTKSELDISINSASQTSISASKSGCDRIPYENIFDKNCEDDFHSCKVESRTEIENNKLEAVENVEPIIGVKEEQKELLTDQERYKKIYENFSKMETVENLEPIIGVREKQKQFLTDHEQSEKIDVNFSKIETVENLELIIGVKERQKEFLTVQEQSEKIDENLNKIKTVENLEPIIGVEEKQIELLTGQEQSKEIDDNFNKYTLEVAFPKIQKNTHALNEPDLEIVNQEIDEISSESLEPTTNSNKSLRAEELGKCTSVVEYLGDNYADPNENALKHVAETLKASNENVLIKLKAINKTVIENLEKVNSNFVSKIKKFEKNKKLLKVHSKKSIPESSNNSQALQNISSSKKNSEESISWRGSFNLHQLTHNIPRRMIFRTTDYNTEECYKDSCDLNRSKNNLMLTFNDDNSIASLKIKEATTPTRIKRPKSAKQIEIENSKQSGKNADLEASKQSNRKGHQEISKQSKKNAYLDISKQRKKDTYRDENLKHIKKNTYRGKLKQNKRKTYRIQEIKKSKHEHIKKIIEDMKNQNLKNDQSVEDVETSTLKFYSFAQEEIEKTKYLEAPKNYKIIKLENSEQKETKEHQISEYWNEKKGDYEIKTLNLENHQHKNLETFKFKNYSFIQEKIEQVGIIKYPEAPKTFTNKNSELHETNAPQEILECNRNNKKSKHEHAKKEDQNEADIKNDSFKQEKINQIVIPKSFERPRTYKIMNFENSESSKKNAFQIESKCSEEIEISNHVKNEDSKDKNLENHQHEGDIETPTLKFYSFAQENDKEIGKLKCLGLSYKKIESQNSDSNIQNAPHVISKCDQGIEKLRREYVKKEDRGIKNQNLENQQNEENKGTPSLKFYSFAQENDNEIGKLKYLEASKSNKNENSEIHQFQNIGTFKFKNDTFIQEKFEEIGILKNPEAPETCTISKPNQEIENPKQEHVRKENLEIKNQNSETHQHDDDIRINNFNNIEESKSIESNEINKLPQTPMENQSQLKLLESISFSESEISQDSDFLLREEIQKRYGNHLEAPLDDIQSDAKQFQNTGGEKNIYMEIVVENQDVDNSSSAKEEFGVVTSEEIFNFDDLELEIVNPFDYPHSADCTCYNCLCQSNSNLLTDMVLENSKRSIDCIDNLLVSKITDLERETSKLIADNSDLETETKQLIKSNSDLRHSYKKVPQKTSFMLNLSNLKLTLSSIEEKCNAQNDIISETTEKLKLTANKLYFEALNQQSLSENERQIAPDNFKSEFRLQGKKLDQPSSVLLKSCTSKETREFLDLCREMKIQKDLKESTAVANSKKRAILKENFSKWLESVLYVTKSELNTNSKSKPNITIESKNDVEQKHESKEDNSKPNLQKKSKITITDSICQSKVYPVEQEHKREEDNSKLKEKKSEIIRENICQSKLYPAEQKHKGEEDNSKLKQKKSEIIRENVCESKLYPPEQKHKREEDNAKLKQNKSEIIRENICQFKLYPAEQKHKREEDNAKLKQNKSETVRENICKSKLYSAEHKHKKEEDNSKLKQKKSEIIIRHDTCQSGYPTENKHTSKEDKSKLHYLQRKTEIRREDICQSNLGQKYKSVEDNSKFLLKKDEIIKENICQSERYETEQKRKSEKDNSVLNVQKKSGLIRDHRTEQGHKSEKDNIKLNIQKVVIRDDIWNSKHYPTEQKLKSEEDNSVLNVQKKSGLIRDHRTEQGHKSEKDNIKLNIQKVVIRDDIWNSKHYTTEQKHKSEEDNSVLNVQEKSGLIRDHRTEQEHKSEKDNIKLNIQKVVLRDDIWNPKHYPTEQKLKSEEDNSKLHEQKKVAIKDTVWKSKLYPAKRRSEKDRSTLNVQTEIINNSSQPKRNSTPLVNFLKWDLSAKNIAQDKTKYSKSVNFSKRPKHHKHQKRESKWIFKLPRPKIDLEKPHFSMNFTERRKMAQNSDKNVSTNRSRPLVTKSQFLSSPNFLSQDNKQTKTHKCMSQHLKQDEYPEVINLRGEKVLLVKSDNSSKYSTYLRYLIDRYNSANLEKQKNDETSSKLHKSTDRKFSSILDQPLHSKNSKTSPQNDPSCDNQIRVIISKNESKPLKPEKNIITKKDSFRSKTSASVKQTHKTSPENKIASVHKELNMKKNISSNYFYDSNEKLSMSDLNTVLPGKEGKFRGRKLFIGNTFRFQDVNRTFLHA